MYVTFSKRFFAVLFLVVLLFLCISGRFSEAVSTEISGETNAERLSFAESIGCEIKEEIKNCKKTVIPTRFDQTYDNYNKLQISAGFDLEKYKGSNAFVYSYDVLSFKDFTPKDNAVLNLLVVDGKIVGGDVSSVSINGKMYPLTRGDYGKDKT